MAAPLTFSVVVTNYNYREFVAEAAEQADETRVAQRENAADLAEATASGEDTSALQKEAERLEEQEATLEDELMRLDTGINARQNILGVQVSGRQAGELTVDDFLERRKAEKVTELTKDQQAAVTFGNELGVEVVVLKGDGDSLFSRSVSQNGNAVVFVHEGSITTKFDGMSEVIHEVSHATAHSDPALYAEIRGTRLPLPLKCAHIKQRCEWWAQKKVAH